MNIQISSDTPALVKKIIGSKNLSENKNGNIDNATLNIDSFNTPYMDNSIITITNIETYYSELGLLSAPLLTEASLESKGLRISSESSSNPLSSILNTNSEVKYLYDETCRMLKKSTESIEIVSKETHLLLSIQYVVNCSFIISNDLSKYYLMNKIKTTDVYWTRVIDNINSLCKSLIKSLQYMNNLIGIDLITFNYASTIFNELTKTADLFNLIVDDIISNNNETTLSNNPSLYSIAEDMKSFCEDYSISENNIPQFSYFKNKISIILKHFNDILQIIIEYASKNADTESLNILYSINNHEKAINHIASAIFLAHSEITVNYDLIAINIKSALSFISLISTFQISLNKLSTEINSEIFIERNNFNFINNNDISNIMPSMNNLFQSSNYVSSSNKRYISETSTASYKLKIDSNNTTNDTTTENIDLNLSFFVCDLKIIVSGTIGTDEFTGYIYYPNMYNINYFGIDNIQINTSIDIPRYINSFKLNECLSPKLTTASVTALSNYSTAKPDTFSANVALSFSLTGEILLTAVLPIVFSQA